MSYLNSPATTLLATHCVSCGRPLVDSVSVESGMGPECRKGSPLEGGESQTKANRLVFEAALAAQAGKAEKVVSLAEQINDLGFSVLADKVARRFKDGVSRSKNSADIVIEEKGGSILVKTPFRRGERESFVKAWQNINGRRYDRRLKVNVVPVTQKAVVWALLVEFFPGKWGVGPKGSFRVPSEKKVKEVQPIQLELAGIE